MSIYDGIISLKLLTFKRHILLSATDLCKQFGPRSGPTKCLDWSGAKTSVPERIFKTVNFEKKSQPMTKNYEKLTSMQRFKFSMQLCCRSKFWSDSSSISILHTCLCEQ